jgi:hypothetical protein
MNKIRTFMTERSLGESLAFGISVRAWISLMLSGTVCWMAVNSVKVEEPLYTLATIAIGFYFGRQSNPKLTTPPETSP